MMLIASAFLLSLALQDAAPAQEPDAGAAPVEDPIFAPVEPQDETPPVLDPFARSQSFQSPEERLDERLNALAEAEDALSAAPLVDEINALWAHSGSDTISLLMDRGRAAQAAGSSDIAARMYDHVNRLAPDYAEGWMASAAAAAALEDWAYALESLNNALTHEPRRYDAYYAIGRLLERAEEYDAALEAYQAAIEIHPSYEQAVTARDRIQAARAGRAL